MIKRLLIFALPLLGLFVFSCEEENPQPQMGVRIQGKDYPVVIIGEQTWLAVNFNGNGGIAYDEANTRPEYGRYYTKAEVESIELTDGWRLPTVGDYEKLAENLGFNLPSYGTHTEQIKTITSSTRWHNANGSNTSGFNAYPAGYGFGELDPREGDMAEFWTTDGITFSIQESGLELKSLRAVFYSSDNSPDFRFNVRFVKDN